MFFFCAPAFAEHAIEETYREALSAISEGRHEDAEALLQQIVSARLPHAGAYLDLAVLYCSMGNREAAEALFATVETRFSPPPVILDVVSSLRRSGCTLRQPQMQQTTLRITRGHEHNVNQGAANSNLPIDTSFGQLTLSLLPEFLAQADNFSSLNLEHQHLLSHATGLGLGVVYQNRRYDRLTRYNTQEIQFTLERPWNLDHWRLRGFATQGFLTLDNALYLRQSSLQIEARPNASSTKPFFLDIAGGAFFLTYPTAPNFDAKTVEARLTLGYRNEKGLLQAAIAQQFDHADANRPGGDRTGQLFALYGRTQLHKQAMGEAKLERQTWHGQQAYQPGFLDAARKQTITTARLGIALKINGNNSVTAEWKAIRNTENIQLFAYNNQVVQLGWQHQFSGF